MKLSGEVDALIATGMNPLQYPPGAPDAGGHGLGLHPHRRIRRRRPPGRLLPGLAAPAPLLRLFPGRPEGVIGARELAITLLKGLVFGGAIPLLCASYGLRVKRSTTEIPQAVTKGAVASLLLVFLAGALLSVALYG